MARDKLTRRLMVNLCREKGDPLSHKQKRNATLCFRRSSNTSRSPIGTESWKTCILFLLRRIVPVSKKWCKKLMLVGKKIDEFERDF